MTLFLRKTLPISPFNSLREFYIKLLRLFRKDIDYFYGETFAQDDLRNKVWVDDFCQLMVDQFNPRSVIDFGCGTGDILAPFEKKGIHVLGLDGSKANKKYSQINEENFILFDLRDPFDAKQKFDLCLCLEVAEHIEEKHSDQLLQNLTGSADTIIFTAAPPGQEGVDHCNLKPKQWWIEKFEKCGFQFCKKLTEELKAALDKIIHFETWYIENLIIFKRL